MKKAVYNPNGVDEKDLPVIYGFNNGGSPGFYNGVLLGPDGVCVGGHVCSSEAFIYWHLGIIEGTRPDRHETFRMFYPNGYKMDFVPGSDVLNHAGVKQAYDLNQSLTDEHKAYVDDVLKCIKKIADIKAHAGDQGWQWWSGGPLGIQKPGAHEEVEPPYDGMVDFILRRGDASFGVGSFAPFWHNDGRGDDIIWWRPSHVN